MTSDDLVAVGRVGPPRGVRGDVFVEPLTDAPDERFAVGSRLRSEPATAGPLEVQAVSRASGKLVVHFAGVDRREAADALRGIVLCVVAAQRPPLQDPEEYYDSDLVGLGARTLAGAELGPVIDVRHAGGATHLVVHCDGRDRLIPFVAAIVRTVDLAAGQVLIDAPEGLLEL
ncbi:MAG TPA: ribosome maturation factor RimM [Jatrophihabitans sp.]|nr:ribosome maturation factor RimM [Jatrophihabitans sp.]